MGTRSTTVIYEGEEPLVALYRQYDGYPRGHGLELASFLANKEIVNGIGADEENTFNGLNDLAVRVIAFFRNSFGGENRSGGLYIIPIERAGEWGEDYLYHVTGVVGQKEAHVRCEENFAQPGPLVLVEGLASKFPAAVSALHEGDDE